MARPKKQTIEYFPHYVNHHKTMFVLESKYGNDGYAFWFKLLEILGNTDGMYYDCKNITNWEFLLAKTHLDGETVTNILNTLAGLNAIDSELWEKTRIIWSQNLVDNVKDAFKKRVSEVPKKPIIDDINSNYKEFPEQNKEFPQRKSFLNNVSGDGNGETKRKETKGKEIKEEEIKEKEILSSSAAVIKTFSENIHPASSLEIEKLNDWIEDVDSEVVIAAIEEAVNYNKRSMSYINAVLNNWLKIGITTKEALESYKRDREIEKHKGRHNDKNKNVSKNVANALELVEKYERMEEET